MCGLAGVILGEKKRTKPELVCIRDLFDDLLVHSEHRGPFATGAAMTKADGSILVEKAPLPASEFVETPEYRSLMEHMGSDVTCLMGHTRWPTRGTHLDNRNNHPLVSEDDSVALSHNGTITNADVLFRRLKLPRMAQVDSEILLRLAERNTTCSGIDVDGFIDDLACCAGRLSVVAVASSRPTEILLIKGNQPMELRYNADLALLAYASEPEILDNAWPARWTSEDIRLPAWTAVTVDADGAELGFTIHPILRPTTSPQR